MNKQPILNEVINNCQMSENYKRKKMAFSLMEAMIILLLISVAVMALIPLMTKKSTNKTWTQIADQAATVKEIVTYGTDRIDRVGIGAAPYQTTSENADGGTTLSGIDAKFAVKDMYYSTSAAATDNNITWGDTYSTATTTYSEIAPADATMRLGNNFVMDQAEMHIGKDDVNYKTAINYDGNGLMLGRTGTGTTSAATDNALLKLTGNDFSFSTASTVTSGTTSTTTYNPIMSYISDTDTLTITPNMTVKGLYLEGFSSLVGDTDACGECIIKKYGDTSDSVYCCKNSVYTNLVTGADSVTTSDRKLKNILSDYKKGIEEISKIDTFLYTFKNDMKKRLHAGLIAQKIIGVFDEALRKDNKGFYSYEKSPVLYAMVNSVKSINKKQDDLLKKQQITSKKADKIIRMYK